MKPISWCECWVKQKENTKVYCSHNGKLVNDCWRLYCGGVLPPIHYAHGAEIIFLLPCYNQFLVEPNDLLNLTFIVYPKKYAHGFVVLCFVVVMQSFIMNSHEVFIHIHQGCFAGTGAIVRLPQCQWSKPDGYGKISQCITTTKHSKAITVCIFLGIYCTAQGTVSIQRLSTVHKFAFLWCGLTVFLSLY